MVKIYVPDVKSFMTQDYSLFVMQVARHDVDPREGLVIGALGMSGEAGEVADLVKKHIFHDHELDRQHLIEEMGDVLWYIAYLASVLDVPMDDIIRTNIKKLEKRYPDGFSTMRSIQRSDD
jgi:NTP pyrophosphatase (non-canonical NTP hydrolase)